MDDSKKVNHSYERLAKRDAETVIKQLNTLRLKAFYSRMADKLLILLWIFNGLFGFVWKQY